MIRKSVLLLGNGLYFERMFWIFLFERSAEDQTNTKTKTKHKWNHLVIYSWRRYPSPDKHKRHLKLVALSSSHHCVVKGERHSGICVPATGSVFPVGV